MTVKGSITDLFQGLPVADEDLYQLIGKPIRDEKRIKIGEIVNIDILNDEYIGVLCEDEQPIPEFLNKKFHIPVSVEVKIDEERINN